MAEPAADARNQLALKGQHKNKPSNKTETAQLGVNKLKFVLAYLDDLYLVCDRSNAALLFHRVREILGRVCHIDANLGKLVAWSKARSPPPDGVLAVSADAWKSDKQESERGIKVLGTPVETNAFVEACAAENLQESCSYFLLSLSSLLFTPLGYCFTSALCRVSSTCCGQFLLMRSPMWLKHMTTQSKVSSNCFLGFPRWRHGMAISSGFLILHGSVRRSFLYVWVDNGYATLHEHPMPHFGPAGLIH